MPKDRNAIRNADLLATYYISGKAFHVHGIYATPETAENEWDIFAVNHNGKYLSEDFYTLPSRTEVIELARCKNLLDKVRV